jgi:isoamylase
MYGVSRFVVVPCRHAHPELRRKTYVNDNDVQWHGEAAFKPDWTDSSRLVAYTLKKTPPAAGGLYVAFNSGHVPKVVELPHWHGRAWKVRGTWDLVEQVGRSWMHMLCRCV